MGDDASDWHHDADRHVSGHLHEGSTVLEHRFWRARAPGAGGGRLPPRRGGDAHRDVNPAEEDQLWVLNFVDIRPLVENVGEPEPE